ncbi:MAG TPA: hypothetical protein GX497_03500 [Bacillus bacterium]|nr:hypothetical protein [Bacillus sp. (in: firmicutes)]
MTTQEAEEKWGLTPGFVRQSITRGKLKSRTGVRKSGKTWLVTAKTMIEVYGEEPKSDDSND